MRKTLKINVPDGYEIDKEKSTFEYIVFKRIGDAEIKWNVCTFSVEIKADGEYFMVHAGFPSYCCSWNDAMRFHKSDVWSLPTVKQLKVLSKHLDAVNAVIRENNGYEITGYFWSREEKDEFYAWNVDVGCGDSSCGKKTRDGYVRSVSALVY